LDIRNRDGNKAFNFGPVFMKLELAPVLDPKMVAETKIGLNQVETPRRGDPIFIINSFLNQH